MKFTQLLAYVYADAYAPVAANADANAIDDFEEEEE